MLHASINIFADNHNALIALLRHVEQLIVGGDVDNHSDLFPDGGFHFVLVGKPEDPEPLSEGQIVVVRSTPQTQRAQADPAMTSSALGQVIKQGEAGATILLSNGEETTVPDWQDRVVAVTYSAYIDSRQQEFLTLERLVADRYDRDQ